MVNSKGVGSYFLSECVDIVERGQMFDIRIDKIVIEGIYKGEIFRFPYIPKEEGYDTEDTG